MRVIIAGSRNITSIDIIRNTVKESGFEAEITEVVSGVAKGVDKLGERWAAENNIPVKQFPAEWKNLDLPIVVVKQGRYGKYNAAAGAVRNEQMAEYADALIAIWDGKSSGTHNMIENANKHKLKVHVKIIT
jgi:hypothetical protein